MKASIPRLRESIKEASMKELKDFLENIRKYSPKIGEMAMRHAAQKLNVHPTLLANGGQDAKKRQVIAPQPNPITGAKNVNCEFKTSKIENCNPSPKLLSTHYYILYLDRRGGL